jgi:hypothetical protein
LPLAALSSSAQPPAYSFQSSWMAPSIAPVQQLVQQTSGRRKINLQREINEKKICKDPLRN